jgi:hypothetical protein
MKKIYLATAALALASVSNAQQVGRGDVLTPFMQEKSKTEVNHEYDRGGSFWSEDFATGFTSANGTWTVGDVNGNIWKASTFGPSGCYSTNTPTPAFTSAANGFMLFDIDSSNCVDASTNPPTITQDDRIGELISPSIDCSGQTSVNVMFEHTFRWCCTAPTITMEVSNDGGNTWTAFDVSGGVAVNVNANNPQTVSLNITSVAAGQANVMIKWRWAGSSHYYWAVDDISLMASPSDEIQFVDSYYRSEALAGANTVPYTIVPTTHAQMFRSFATISNQGSNSADVTFQSELLDAGMTAVVSETGTQTTVTAGNSYNDSTAAWMSPSTTGAYTLVNNFDYANIANDADLTNNEDQFMMEVTDSVYGRDDMTPAGGLWNGAGSAYEMGPVYRPVINDNLAYVQVAFGANTVAGTIAYVVIYQIDQATGDFVEVFNGSGTLSSEITLTAAEIGTGFINIPVDTDGLGTPLAVSANEEYIVCVGHYGGPDDVLIANGGMVAPDQTVFILSGDDNTWYYMTSTPAIRMVFSDNIDGIEDENPIGLALGQNYPNPTNGVATIAYSVEEAAEISFTVTDIAGKVILTSDEGTVVAGEHTFEINTANLAEGMYNYTINANGITMTKRMVVKH